MNRYVAFWALSAALMLSACSDNNETETGAVTETQVKKTTGSAPDKAIMAIIDAAKSNNIATLMQLTVSDENFAQLKSDWQTKKNEPISEEERAMFEEQMIKFTADDANDIIMADIQPKLDEMKPQLAFLVPMFQGMMNAEIDKKNNLGEDKKDAAKKAIESINKWAQETDLTSPELARKSVEIFTSTARDLELKTIDDLHALSFEQALEKGGKVVGAAKEILAVYGLSIDDMLDSVSAETVTQSEGSATVNVKFSFLGTDQEVETKMLKLGERWLNEDAASYVESSSD